MIALAGLAGRTQAIARAPPASNPSIAVTANGHAGGLYSAHGRALAELPAYSRQRFEYAVRARRHLDIPSIQRDQRRTMADRDDRRVRQDLAQHAVDFRFQLLVERRCRLIEEQPIRLVENSPRDRQTLLLASCAMTFSLIAKIAAAIQAAVAEEREYPAAHSAG